MKRWRPAAARRETGHARPLADPAFIYPSIAFRRAWDALVCNDEHGYGTAHIRRPSTIRGCRNGPGSSRGWPRRRRSARGLECAGRSPRPRGRPSSSSIPRYTRCETVEVDLPETLAERSSARCPGGPPCPACAVGRRLRFMTSEIPPLGYAVFPLAGGGGAAIETRSCAEPPSIENDYYRLTFGANGSITGIVDKQLDRQLIDAAARTEATSSSSPETCTRASLARGARFEIETGPLSRP